MARLGRSYARYSLSPPLLVNPALPIDGGTAAVVVTIAGSESLADAGSVVATVAVAAASTELISDSGVATATVATTATSSRIGVSPLTPVPFQYGDPPFVNGTARVGRYLQCWPGAWGNDPTGYGFQWQRDTLGNGVFVDLAGETNHYYLLGPADLGSYVRCVMAASNAAGSTVYVANALPVSPAAPGTPNVAEPYPQLLVQLDLAPFQFAPSPPPPNFVDVTRFVRDSITTQRGRQNELDRIEAGQVSLTLDSSLDHRFEPEYSGPTLAATVSGNEISDTVRAAMSMLVPSSGLLSSDGLYADSSYGIWESTTNIIGNTNLEVDASSWVAQGLGTTITRVSTTAKFGAFSLQIVPATRSDGSEAGAQYGPGAIGLTNAQVYTCSCWVCPPAGKAMRLQINGTSMTGGGVGGASSPNGDGVSWYRVTLTFTAIATSTANTIYVLLNGGNALGTCYADGLQLETKGYPTPYVHTPVGATATRAAARVQLPAALLGAQGWSAFQIRPEWASNAAGRANVALLDWRTDANNLIQVGYDFATASFYVSRIIAGVTQTAFAPTFAFSAGAPVTVVASWTNAQIAISVNGIDFVSQADARSLTPTGTLFDVGGLGTSSWMNGEILWAAFGTGTLANADAALLAIYNSDPLIAKLAYTDPTGTYRGPLSQAAAFTGLWTADSTLINTPGTSLFYPNVLPVRRVRVQAVYGATLYSLGVGYWDPQLSWPDFRREHFALQATDGFEALVGGQLLVTLPTGLSGAQIVTLLKAANWQGQARGTDVIDVGEETMVGVAASLSAPQGVLSLIQTIADSEQGLFFMDGSGRAIFHSRDHRITATRSTMSQALFGDGGPASGELPYVSLSPDYDIQRVADDVQVTSGVTSAAAQRNFDPVSIGQFGPRVLARSTSLSTDGAAINQAGRLLSDLKNPFVRYPEMVVQPWRDTRLWPVVLGSELSDRVVVNRRPYGLGATIEKVMYVEGVRQEITVGGAGQVRDWHTTFYLALADKTHYWVLEDPTYGLLDSTAILR